MLLLVKGGKEGLALEAGLLGDGAEATGKCASNPGVTSSGTVCSCYHNTIPQAWGLEQQTLTTPSSRGRKSKARVLVVLGSGEDPLLGADSIFSLVHRWREEERKSSLMSLPLRALTSS